MSDETPAEPEAGSPSSLVPSGRRGIPLWKQRRYQLIAGGIAGALIVGGVTAMALSGDDDESAVGSATTRATDTSTQAPTTSTVYAGPFAPLSGVADPKGETQDRAAMTVKIDNTLKEGPKRGVDQADIVYEEVVEGGYTRLAAIFQSHVPTDIGPIRSVRLTDQAIVRPIGGLFVYSGGARYAEDSIATAPVLRVDESAAGDAMYRDDGRAKPVNLFGRGPELFAFGGDPKPPPALFLYRRPNQHARGIPITTAHVGFEAGLDVTWNWDAASKSWHRIFLGEQEFVDDGAPIAPANIIVQFVDYVGGGTPEAQLTGEGAVWVLTDGQAIQGRWSRPDAAQPGELVDADGKPIRLTPGQTWVELPENGYEFTVG